MPVNSNITDGTELFFSLIYNSIAAMMVPPLVYFITFSMCPIILAVIWGFMSVPKDSLPYEDDSYLDGFIDEGWIEQTMQNAGWGRFADPLEELYEDDE